LIDLKQRRYYNGAICFIRRCHFNYAHLLPVQDFCVT